MPTGEVDARDWLEAELADTLDEEATSSSSEEPALSMEIRKIYRRASPALDRPQDGVLPRAFLRSRPS